MKHLLLFALLTFALTSVGQYPGNANDWVEYNKDYYRFSVMEDGIYRLTTADLQSAGIPVGSLVGSNFKMIRNGEEVPLFVTTNGEFSDNDFIEFLGKKNQGDTDTPLYSSPDLQPSKSKSLFSDQSVYFLTFDSASQNKRITLIENNLTNTPQKEEGFIATVVQNPGIVNKGYHIWRGSPPVAIYESTYEQYEGYNNLLKATRTLNLPTSLPQIDQSSNTPTLLSFSVATTPHSTQGLNSGTITTTFGAVQNTNATESDQILRTIELEYPSSNITETSNITITNNNTANTIAITEQIIKYPRLFSFPNESFGYINLSKPGSVYIELENLPTTNNSSVVVYDLSNNERIEETINTITPIRTSSTSVLNDLVFSTEIKTPVFENKTNFSDFTTYSDIIVIYHSAMETPVDGENQVQKFIDFKSSEVGGNWNIKKANITEVVDQYAYGIKAHSAAIKNLASELKEKGTLPKYFILIGKGYEYYITATTAYADHFIPTFGTPGSDSKLVSDYGSSDPNCTIGRIGARTPEELKNYIDKVIEYQTLVNDTSDSAQTKEKLWMKTALHMSGGKTLSEERQLKGNLETFAEIFKAPYQGGQVDFIYKESTNLVKDNETKSLDSVLNRGTALINYLGHSNPTALNYSLHDFSTYNQQGKYPFMLTNGCYIGDLFQTKRTLSEDFIFSKNAGVLTFMGPSKLGFLSGLYSMTNNFYKNLSINHYGASIGELLKISHNELAESVLTYRLVKQQVIFHGDPTLSIYSHQKPDYLIEAEDIILNKEEMTSANRYFTVHAVISNIGKAIEEPVEVKMTRILPDGETESKVLIAPHIYYQDTISFKFETKAYLSDGVNEFTVEIDPENKLDEITRANNNTSTSATEEVKMNVVEPILPAEFSITNNPATELIAYAPLFTQNISNFEIEIDTTEEFNSSALQSTTVTSKGGTIKWQPTIMFQDEVVYYWRVKKEGQTEWATSSFMYSEVYSSGWNQSDYFQFLKDDYHSMTLEENQLFETGNINRIIDVRTALFPTIPNSHISYGLDGILQDKKKKNTNFAVAILDKETGNPIKNNSSGLYGSIYASNTPTLFYYNTDTEAQRATFMNMIDEVEDGNYILIFSIVAPNPNENNWATDGNSLIAKLEAQGATEAANIQDNAPYVFFFQKGNPIYEGNADFAGVDSNSIIDENFPIEVFSGKNYIETPLIGPANNWNMFEWEWDNSYDNIESGDNITYTIIGVTNDGSETILINETTAPEYDLSTTNASTYPYVKVQVNFVDDTNHTLPQLNKLRLTYDTLPDLAINPTDPTLQTGRFIQTSDINVSYDIENVSTKDMSEVLVDYTYATSLVEESSTEQRYAALPAQTTQTINYELDTSLQEQGYDLLIIEANPNADQPELYDFNNIAIVELTGTPLPVKFLYFKAEPTINNTTMLNWATASEINNSHFAIEHSTNGVYFVKIGSVQGAGTITTEQTYSFEHTTPVEGVNYYRINQVDFDGKSEYTDIETVEFGRNTVIVYPNPTTDSFKININEMNVTVTVYDATGRLVFKDNNYAQQEIDVTNLEKGTYIVIIETNQNTYQQKLIKH